VSWHFHGIFIAFLTSLLYPRYKSTLRCVKVTITAKDTESLQEALAALVQAGKTVALVPTMGALHTGHLSLIELAKQKADAVVLSIFVNPKQFGPNEDFAKYPRTLEADVTMAHECGVDVVYAPSVEDLYPQGFSTSISVGKMATILCGKTRPGHFDGVATVLTKLFLRILPHVAVFGEKDYQQLSIIRRLAEDLDLPVEILAASTFRESSGLAMSSRNRYLSADERALAPKIYEVLKSVAAVIVAGKTPVKTALEQGVMTLGKAGFMVDYLELRDTDTLGVVDTIDEPARLLVAAWLGNTRLIDNIEVE
jgi:pantoate--beta-alanine ligase